MISCLATWIKLLLPQKLISEFCQIGCHEFFLVVLIAVYPYNNNNLSLNFFKSWFSP